MISTVGELLRDALYVGLGGVLGSVTRFALQQFFVRNYPSIFPYSTFIANLVGCFLIGLFFGWVAKGSLSNNALIIFLTTGFCGSLTTFSTFSLENVRLLTDGHILVAVSYVVLSLTLGFLFVWFGFQTSQMVR